MRDRDCLKCFLIEIVCADDTNECQEGVASTSGGVQSDIWSWDREYDGKGQKRMEVN